MKIKETYWKKGNLIIVVDKAVMEENKTYPIEKMDEYEGEEDMDDILEFIAQKFDIIIVEDKNMVVI